LLARVSSLAFKVPVVKLFQYVPLELTAPVLGPCVVAHIGWTAINPIHITISKIKPANVPIPRPCRSVLIFVLVGFIMCSLKRLAFFTIVLFLRMHKRLRH
jgi:hypothetical protein